MDVRIRNLMGVESADFPLSAITLIAGHNAAGKSSIIEALAAAVTQTPAARGATTKKAIAGLLREGTEAGSVSITWGDEGGIRVDYPSGEVRTRGTLRSLGTALGVGALRWSQIDAKRRHTELTERLNLSPSMDDLRVFLDDRATEKTVAAVWKLIEDQGWDGALKRAQEKATTLRGRWVEAADTPFGATKARGWRPNVLLKDESYDEQACADAVEAAKAHLETLIRAGAIEEAEIKRVEQQAAELGSAQAEEAAAQQQHAEADAALEKAESALAQIPPIDNPPGAFLACPHCSKEVVFKPATPDRLARLEVPPKPMTAAEIKAKRLERQALDQSITRLRRAVDEARDAQAIAVRKRTAAEQAVTRLAELRALPRTDAEAMAEAREAVSRAEVILRGVQQMNRAAEIFREWELTQPVIEALAPEGVRAAVTKRAMDAFNADLAALSESAGFPTVAVGENTDLTLGGRTFTLLSESEKWRADLIVTLALAQHEKASLVLVDRLDILHPQARPGVFEALRALGIPAVVAYTAKDAATVPPLQRLAYGRSYWMEAGRLAPLG